MRARVLVAATRRRARTRRGLVAGGRGSRRRRRHCAGVVITTFDVAVTLGKVRVPSEIRICQERERVCGQEDRGKTIVPRYRERKGVMRYACERTEQREKVLLRRAV